MRSKRVGQRKRRVTLLGSERAKVMGLALLLVAVAMGRLCVGEFLGWPEGDFFSAVVQVLFGDITHSDEALTIMDLRVHRLVLGVIVGVGLAISGVALQALLRNPLAEPFILGLSTGAGVGVMAQMLLGAWMGWRIGGTHFGALLGAGASMGIVLLAGQKRGVIDPLGLLLVGVVLSTINGAAIMLLNYILGPAGIKEDVARWMMGYLNEGVSATGVLVVAIATVAGWLLLQRHASAMDAATFSDSEARSVGVDLRRLRFELFLVASVLAAGGVVLAGPIAFVGLVGPHVARLLLGPGHRMLIPGAAMVGAVLIVGSDIASVLIGRAYGVGLLPIGIFTAVLGGVVFLWMLRPRLGRGG